MDTILWCDREDAKKIIDIIGFDHIQDWDFLDSGKVKLILNCRLSEILSEV